MAAEPIDLETAIDQTKRAGVVGFASALLAGTGALLLLTAAQYGTFLTPYHWFYKGAPWVIGAGGLGLLLAGSRLYSQRIGAAWTGTIGAAALCLVTAATAVLLLVNGVVSILLWLVTPVCLIAAIVASLTIPHCRRTAAVRARAAAAGMDIDL